MFLLRISCIGSILLCYSTSSYAGNIKNLLSNDLSLRLVFVWICMSMFAGAFVWLFYSVLNYRKKNQTPFFHQNKWTEIIWTSVPLLMVLIMALPALAKF